MVRETSPEERSLAIRAAWLSYLGGYTQSQIAERLGVSPAKVHRLIAAAHQAGSVKVFVDGTPAECVALEDRLKAAFDLSHCIVAPDLGEEGGDFAAVATAAARFLIRSVERDPAQVIGVGHGRTLAALADRLPRQSWPQVRFVSLLGGLTRRAATNPFGVVHHLAERCGGEGYFLPVPFIADSVADKQVLMAQKIVRDVIELSDSCRLVLAGIGELGPSAHMLVSGMITREEYEALKAAGAVGDVFGRFFDAEGRFVACEINQRSCGVELEALRGREVVAVAGGEAKTQAILGALRSGLLRGLITDERTAGRLLGLMEASPGIREAVT